MATQEEIRIGAPRVVPFNERPTCPACNDEGISAFVKFVRTLRGKAPITTLGRKYCGGGKAPSEPQKHIPSVVIRDLGIPDKEFRCAGIMEPHLHMKCGACGYEFFMRTKNRIEAL